MRRFCSVVSRKLLNKCGLMGALCLPWRRTLSGMELLKVGVRVENRSGWTGTVVEVDDTNATVRWDNGEPPGRFGRDEHHRDGGVLTLI